MKAWGKAISLTILNQLNHEIDDGLCVPGNGYDVWPVHPEGAGDGLGLPLVLIAPGAGVAVAHAVTVDVVLDMGLRVESFDVVFIVLSETYTTCSFNFLSERIIHTS